MLSSILGILWGAITLYVAYVQNKKKREYEKKQKELADLVDGDNNAVSRRLDAILRASDNHPSRKQDS